MNQFEKDQLLLTRRKKKINQKEISKYLGVSQTLVSLFETNERSMTSKHINMYKNYINNK